MRRRLSIFLVLAALAAVLIFSWRSREPAPKPTPRPPAPVEAVERVRVTPPPAREVVTPPALVPALATETFLCGLVVVDALTEEPLAGVAVTVTSTYPWEDDAWADFRAPTTTDELGHAGFSVPSRQHRFGVALRLPGYEARSIGLSDEEIRVALEPRLTYRARIIDGRRGEPIEGALVALWDIDEAQASHFTKALDGPIASDADGRVALTGVRPGHAFVVYVRHTGLGTAIFVRTLVEIGVEEDLVVGLGGGLSGRVTIADGTPLGDAEVIFAHAGDDNVGRSNDAPWMRFRRGRVRTDADGRYAVEGLRIDRRGVPYEWVAVAFDERGAMARSAPVTFASLGESAMRDIAFGGRAVLRVRVERGAAYEGRPLIVRVQPKASSETVKQPLEPDENEVVVPDLDPDRYHVSVREPDRFPFSRGGMNLGGWVELRGGQETLVEMSLTGVALTGVVRFTDGASAPGAEVSFTQPVGSGVHRTSTAVTDAAGEFTMTVQQGTQGWLSIGPPMMSMPGQERAAARDAILRQQIADFDPTPGHVELTLPRAAGITFRIAGELPESVQMRVRSRSGSHGERPEQTEGFVVYGLPPDTPVAVWLYDDGRPLVVIPPRRLRPGETRDLGTLSVPDRVGVSGTVRDGEGRPIEGASVTLPDPWFGHASPLVRTDADGRFRIADLPRIATRLRFDDAAGLASRDVTVAAEDLERPLDAVLTPGGLLRATVRAGDAALAGASVYAVPEGDFISEDDGNRFSAASDQSGRVTLRLAPGRYKIKCIRRDDVPRGEARRELPPIEIRDGAETPVTIEYD